MKQTTLLLLLVVLAVPAGAAEPASGGDRGFGRVLPKEQRAPVKYESPKGGIFFQVKLAGREVWATLDTGSSHSLVDAGFARAAGLTLTPQDEKTRTPRGEMQMWRAPELTLLIPGQMELQMQQPRVADLAAFGAMTTHKFEFVLGQDILSALVLVVDPARQVFLLGPSGSFKTPPQTVQVALNGNVPEVEAKIGGERVVLSIDTGFNGQISLVPEAWARVVSKDARLGSAITATAEGKTFAAKSTMLPEIQIGTLSLPGVEAREAPNPTAQGLLGTDILLKFRFALDMKAGSLWLAPLPPK